MSRLNDFISFKDIRTKIYQSSQFVYIALHFILFHFISLQFLFHQSDCFLPPISCLSTPIYIQRVHSRKMIFSSVVAQFIALAFVSSSLASPAPALEAHANQILIGWRSVSAVRLALLPCKNRKTNITHYRLRQPASTRLELWSMTRLKLRGVSRTVMVHKFDATL